MYKKIVISTIVLSFFGGCTAMLVGTDIKKGITLLQECKNDKALAIFEAIVKSDSSITMAPMKNQTARIKSASIYLDRGEVQKAEALYPKIMKESMGGFKSIEHVENIVKHSQKTTHYMRKQKGFNPKCK